MAEGIIEGLLGGEEPEELEAAEGVLAADAAALVVAMDAARFDPELSRKAGEYLDRQRELAEYALRHFEEEHHLSIAAAKRKRTSDHLKISLQCVIALVAIGLAFGLADMVRHAFTSRSVVVETFQAPPALADRGLSGQVVAEGVLDALQRLQDATRSPQTLLTTKSAWSSDIKIDVPETGISIGEINRLLVLRFGRDTHISGDLTQTETGDLDLAVRGDDVPPASFHGASTELDKITTQAAEYIYGRSQPFEFATYLVDANRDSDAVQFLPGAYLRATDNIERTHLANRWGIALLDSNDSAAALAKFELAISLAPNQWGSWTDLMNALYGLGREEESLQQARSYLAAVDKAPKKTKPRLYLLATPALHTWDMPLVLQSSLAFFAQNKGTGAGTVLAATVVAQSYALIHNIPMAQRFVALGDPKDSVTAMLAPFIEITQDKDRNDPAAGLQAAKTFWKLWLATPSIQAGDNNPCQAALIFGLAEDPTDANAVFKKLPPYSDCIAAQGQIIEHNGDVAGAEKLWANGVHLAPSPPAIYIARGISRMNRGDAGGAEADFAHAHSTCPRYADPLKAWGDLLAREGRWKDALAKYNEALRYAPAWPQLHQAFNDAYAHLRS